MADQILTPRDLNRILLGRQMLLSREKIGAVEALERLFAIQAQLPRAPFLGLWARLEGFQRADLLAAIHERQVVRSTLMRGTLHLASARDVLAFRTTVMPPRDVTLPGGVRPAPEELVRVLDLARRHFAPEPKDFESVRQVLEAEGVDPVRPLAFAARMFLPLVQASSNAAFGHEPGGDFTLAKTWLGRDEDLALRPQDLARRYLAAHGPSLPADFAGWSGQKAAAAIFEALGDELVTFRDERKRTLFDLKDAPRPSGETSAPVRLLADFDGAVLGRADRTGVIRPEHAPLLASKNGLIPAMVLVDGVVAGTWRIEPKMKSVAVSVRLFGAVSAEDRKTIEAEAISAAKFLEPDAAGVVTFAEA
ncbi:MAG: winged helix DNA-binding domain-containing protein [Pseudomonadota bacterium]|uniref:winged helix DNA-binding domain-containing protein n=1 Tax=Phenylobacterium sp. TaxID=1871053 RepID=UPI0025EFB0A2|nr:winged helix DNA-binding domain-containing protein [Phenylobacterium sp.]MBT9473501.1 AlkZ family DNA glycosylase [Phenylobacterium sp.]